MNDKIDKLFTQATFDESRIDVRGRYHPYIPLQRTDQPFTYEITKEQYEKFADLIIQECAGLFINQRYMILDPLRPFAEERVRTLKEHDKHTVIKILKHFGVKE